MNKTRLTVLGAALACVMMSAGCDDTHTVKTPVFNTGLPAFTNQASSFEKIFPRQYATYKQNDESTVMTEYNGSSNYRKNDNVHQTPPQGWKHAQPYLKNLWLGYAFAYEYNAARGHTHAVEDILEIDRINRYAPDGKGNQPATCWNCKTPNMVQWVQKDGDKFWSRDFNELRENFNVYDESISCATCHDTTNMEMKLYSIPLQDYLKRTGQDFDAMSRNEKRSLMCGQCHVEYYFAKAPGTVPNKPTFPWDNGFDVEQVYEYYQDKGENNGPFVDFVHAVSGVKILKAQHPDYETWKTGPHGTAGVSCADCHMPYQREDGKKFSSHWWTSPLKDAEMRACRKCHADKTPEYLRGRVLDTQQKTFAQLLKAQEASVRAHEAVRLANEFMGERNAEYDSLMAEAREMTRKGQFFWDMVSAENSVGFHNPTRQLDALMSSAEYSQKAVELCLAATNGAIIAGVSGDITKLVPPILEFSREMQMDPEALKSHTWLTYMKPLPKTERVWALNKRIK
ncbi:ammonia-forming cytochrome c nitrite reductase subunit c552 [uncultured Mailhella sp.]|uniref:ammonia-forming cytochrome c nitrite reductase subunit c552 n=1 Tax=uncultured Mailhella sp. TaxID=1981031 RepID=UPI002624B1A4|nr:ammonia-forming cytochrome c nitrite reductase subunit c552 [uncultured Mailhella sp.]